MKKIAVFISGSGTNLQSLIDAINIGKINGEIVLVCSNRKNAYGLIRAKDNNIDTLYLSPGIVPYALGQRWSQKG